MFTAFWLGGPALAGALLTFITRPRRSRAYILFAVGVGLALAFVAVTYLLAPRDYQDSQGAEDGEMFLGRWWEPQWIAFVAIVGYFLWALGVVGGLLINGAIELARGQNRIGQN